MSLVLSRDRGEKIVIEVDGVRVWITVDAVRNGRTRLVVDAPPEAAVYREEVWRDLRRRKGAGVASIIGKWPGDETDEEVRKALEELS